MIGRAPRSLLSAQLSHLRSFDIFIKKPPLSLLLQVIVSLEPTCSAPCIFIFQSLFKMVTLHHGTLSRPTKSSISVFQLRRCDGEVLSHSFKETGRGSMRQLQGSWGTEVRLLERGGGSRCCSSSRRIKYEQSHCVILNC